MAGVLAPIAARRGLLGLLLGLALAHFAHRQRRRAERAAGRALLRPTGFVDKLHATVALAHLRNGLGELAILRLGPGFLEV